MNGEVKKQLMKELREMDLIDNFLFSEVMADEKNGKKVCRLILSRVLKREIGDVEFTPEKVVPGVTEKSHGIRMDAYVREIDDSRGGDHESIKVYDIEPDKRSGRKEELPKRSRYYADLIDVQLLETGMDYDKLPELVSIFILSYDPFGANSMIYEVGNVIKSFPEIPYNDGIRRIFLYVDGELPGDAGEDEKKLQALLKYIGRSVDENVTDEATRELNDIVKQIKKKSEVGARYMKSWLREKELKEEVREEERKKIEAERKRADKAEKDKAKAEKDKEKAEKERASAVEDRMKLEAELAKYKAKFGEIA